MILFFKKEWIPITLLGFLFALFYCILQNYIAVVWFDEICFSDTPINYILYGKWHSFVWNYTYNPLHAFLLMGWMKIFGISHASVCNMNILFALISFLIIEFSLINGNYIKKRSSGYILTILFWLGFTISGIMTKGRIDILIMLLTVILISFALKKNFSFKHYCIIFLTSYLLMMSGMYVIPIVSLFFIYLFAINYNGVGRRVWFFRGLIVAFAFMVSFLSICYFYYLHNFLLHYLSSFFTFNSNFTSSDTFLDKLLSTFYIKRIFSAYFVDTISLVLLAIVWFLYYSIKKENKQYLALLLFISLIPLCMVLIGRYQPYYTWIFTLPIILLFCIFYDILPFSTFKNICFSVVILLSFLRPAYWLVKRPAEYKERVAIEHFIQENNSLITKYKNVYFVNAVCYYAIVDLKGTCYFLNNDNLQVSNVVELFINNLLKLKKYKEYMPSGKLPNSGIVINTNNKDELQTIRYLSKNGYSYNIVKNNNFMSIYSFNR